MAELKIHVEDMGSVFDRAMSIARRLDAGERDMAEFHFSYDTMELFLRTLTPGRWTLLGVLRRHGPWSIRALAGALGRDYKAVHTDVTTLIEAGFVERDEGGHVFVPWARITAELDVAAA